ncbi:MAG TPA: TadE/TadG family type IV pilus assembly protein [Vicinamibacterales bacterium]|nr:TadE/TadG family type IV pilus assembly protein [Vicinamibacterales bacterium]
MHNAVRRLGGSNGSNLLEAAIITPLLLILTLGLVDFASMFYVYLALENGVSLATRYAVTGNQMADPNNPSQLLSHDDSIKAAMRQATPALTIADADFTFNHMPMGGSGWLGGSGGPGDIAKVTIDYVWVPLTPILRPFLTNGQLMVEVASAMKNESKFQ